MRKVDKDKRINAPLISIRDYLTIFFVLYLLIVGQAFILTAYFKSTLTLVGTLLWYVLVCCLLISLTLGLLRRHYYGRPIQIISKAARKVSNGDFNTQIKAIRKDGKKDEIEVLIEDFNKMTRELQSTELFKNDFIANVSHEIKSPLSIIKSYTEALSKPNLSNNERKKIMNTIVLATDNLSSMVTNMLKLNKLENQEVQPKVSSFQLGEQLRVCALNYITEWENKNLNFYINVIDIEIDYDASLLELVWNNLISNAIKFTEPGGEIKVTSYRDRNFVYVSVTDSGRGIKKEDSNRIFDRFYQVDPSRSTEGNGLGLSLVKKIVDMVQGQIIVDSELRKGTTFTVQLKI